MTPHEIVLLFTLFCIKHFLVDFLFQGKWQYSNKHIFGHLGGIYHAWLHGITTVVILIYVVALKFNYVTILYIGVIECIIHYIIDWGKMNIALQFNWKCNTHEEFWWLTGFDQLLHYLTYIGIMVYLI